MNIDMNDPDMRLFARIGFTLPDGSDMYHEAIRCAMSTAKNKIEYASHRIAADRSGGVEKIFSDLDDIQNFLDIPPSQNPGSLIRFMNQEADEQEGDGDGDSMDPEEVETDKRHPGDKFDAAEFPACFDSPNPEFSPITTKAGEGMYHIVFADNTTKLVLSSAYGHQFNLRLDVYRRMLVYDCVEFVPSLQLGDFHPTNKDMRDIDKTLDCGMGGRDDPFDFDEDEEEDLDAPAEIIVKGKKAKTAAETTEQQKTEVYAELTAARVMQSRLFRLRLSLENLKGIRLLEHTPSEAEHFAGLSSKGIGVLILDLCTPLPSEAFASRHVCSGLQAHDRFKTIPDWTPQKVASTASRHYLIGEHDELQNVLGAIVKVSPHVLGLLGSGQGQGAGGQEGGAGIQHSEGGKGEKSKKRKQGASSSSSTAGGQMAGTSASSISNQNSLLSMSANLKPSAAIKFTADEEAKTEKKSQDDGGDGSQREGKKPKSDTAVSSASGQVSGGAGGSAFVMTEEDVNAALRERGVRSPEETSRCLRAGILRGKVKLQGPEVPLSSQIVLEGKCIVCDAKVKASIEDLLNQPDGGGADYEDGGQDASVQCPEGCCGLYVTGICRGDPSFDSGKFHNHCEECPGFGECLGDYRMSHCT
uniref:Uncharacterized protein n=1 Tax=Chromera velia CCMP2878 TaxID=1169474 RepID=A0A0G4HE62_9ALVE|eukprot:Cvel_26680.t1-p1 / transcript=Cvel_26680.t1 / gene=Cvel_26680 / organism=Chromera_velia_CCMP2878 / gene_product=hypothetical protein / transcript_product=hypothetical protein / location=Cvel_scaffold3213:4196-6985(-) / protein_length=641 / sequence_SO=supercontig / SO=protein_coding / is_pseudo=false